ncbi:MAG: hypothetical protein ABIZ70_09940 [Gemmatimonadales bacterium]
MKRWPLMVMAVVMAVTACTQKLTTPADCPALCPGGQSAFRDTILDAEIGLDSSYSGYTSTLDAVGLLASNGGSYGESRFVVKFLRRGDSVLVKDTSRTFTIDSAVVQVTLQKRDPAVLDLVLEFYRLPRSVDTLSGFEVIDPLMIPANKLGEVSVPNSAASGLLQLTLKGDDLAKLAFQPSDTTQLAIGVKIRSASPTGTRFGSLLSGAESPLFATFVHADIADTAVQRQIINRNPALNLTVRPAEAPPGAGVLAVGGFPAARAFLRFTLPPYLRDSARIIRATLELSAAQPIFGIPADTAFLDARAVLSDFGPKSPVTSNAFGSVVLLPGMSVFQIEMVPVVQLWQGSAPLPSIVRLGLGSEGATFLKPLLNSTRAATGRPRLRLTYRLPFAFEGF